MPNLTTKELAGLSDQLDFERVLYSKYQTAVQETTDQELKTCFQNLAGQHQQNHSKGIDKSSSQPVKHGIALSPWPAVFAVLRPAFFRFLLAEPHRRNPQLLI